MGTDDEQEDDEAFENQVKIIAFCQLLLRVLGLAVNKILVVFYVRVVG